MLRLGVACGCVVAHVTHSLLLPASFKCVMGGESDVRFAYCACVISYMLNDWSGFDVEKCAEWIRRCQVLLLL